MEAIASESIAEDCLALDSGVFTPAAGFSANSAIADLPLVLEEVAPVSVPALVGGGSNADSVTVTLPQQSNTSGTASGSMSSTWDINVSGTGGGVAKFKTPCGTEMLSSPSAVTDAVIAGSTWTPNSGDAVTSLAGRVQIDAEYTYDESETDPNVKYDNVLAGYTTVSTGITITSNTGTSASTAIRPQFSGFRKFTATRTGRVRFDLSAGTMTDYKLAVCSAAGGYLESVGTNETYSTNGAHIGNITSGQEYILEVRNDHSTGTSQTATFRVTEFLVGLPPQISRDDGDAPVSVGTEVPYTIDNVVGSVGTDYIYVQDITNGDLTIDGNPVSVGDYIAISTALGATFTPSGSGASFTLGGSVGNSSDGIGLSETFTTATLDIQSQGRGRGNRGRGRGPMVWGPSR
jgi:hypothetical protein